MRQHQQFHRKQYAGKPNSNDYEAGLLGVDEDQVDSFPCRESETKTKVFLSISLDEAARLEVFLLLQYASNLSYRMMNATTDPIVDYLSDDESDSEIPAGCVSPQT